MNLKAEFPYFGFEASVMPTDASYPNGVPGNEGLLPARRSPYVRKKIYDVSQKYKMDDMTVRETFEEYARLLSSINANFEHILEPYDREVILPTTCALSLKKPSHTDLDATGKVGRNSKWLFPESHIKAVSDYYRQFSDTELDEKELKLTLPRGKNAGWPLVVGGRSRDLSDILLSVNVALMMYAQKAGLSLTELTEQLTTLHGPNFTVAGERYQHTKKVMPLGVNNEFNFSHNFEPRVRGIYMSPKYCVAWNRRAAKLMLKRMMRARVHEVQRDEIKNRIADWKKKGWLVIAVDVSKFDQTFGGIRGRQILEQIAKLTDSNFEDLWHEFSYPIMLFGKSGAFIDDSAPILSSGISTTTVINCFANLAIQSFLISILMKRSSEATMKSLGQDWDALLWGDDAVLAIKTSKSQDEVLKLYEQMDLSVTSEPTVKFLGVNYDMLNFTSSSLGYPIGRFIQQQFFGERKKDYPFGVIGYVARLSLMDQKKAREVHRSMLPFWDRFDFRDKFSFDQAPKVIETLLPMVEKYSAKISQLDDVLGVLTHGIYQEDLLPHSDYEGFDELLKVSSIDVTDPVQVAEDAGVRPTLTNGIRDLMRGDFSAYTRILNELVLQFNLRWKFSSDVLY